MTKTSPWTLEFWLFLAYAKRVDSELLLDICVASIGASSLD